MPLKQYKIDAIRSQERRDWSKQVLEQAGMLLLGNSDYDYMFQSAPSIMWRLYGADNMDRDYAIFKIPFINVVDKVFAKVRNLTYRYMPNQMTLFPMETEQYDSWLMRELLDRIQKGLPVEKKDVDKLRSQKLVEGRSTSLYLSASAAQSIDKSVAYIKNKGFDDKYYKLKLPTLKRCVEYGNRLCTVQLIIGNERCLPKKLRHIDYHCARLQSSLIHADYHGLRGIVIRKEADKLILANPGYIRTGKKQMRLGGESDPRNKALMKMFNLINIGERAGSGVPNIFNVWADEGWEEPIIEERFDPDRKKLKFFPKRKRSLLLEGHQVKY